LYLLTEKWTLNVTVLVYENVGQLSITFTHF
jgi:hypothetical protein